MNDLQRYAGILGEIDSLYHEAAYRLGQSDSSMTVLYTLLYAGGTSEISDICRLSGMRKQTLNSALRKLEKEQLLILISSSGKNKKATLTETGKKIAERSAGVLQGIEEQALSDWTENEIQTYLSLSERYLNRFRELVMRLPSKEDYCAAKKLVNESGL